MKRANELEAVEPEGVNGQGSQYDFQRIAKRYGAIDVTEHFSCFFVQFAVCCALLCRHHVSDNISAFLFTCDQGMPIGLKTNQLVTKK